jgi:hypothetical protein
MIREKRTWAILLRIIKVQTVPAFAAVDYINMESTPLGF